MATLEIVKSKLAAMTQAEEYFNALSTNIQLSGTNIKVVAISSVQPNEGKSTISTNLATAFARAGYRTLLIDADIRNSVMTGVFKSQGRVAGLTEVLSGKSEISQAIATTDYPKLDVLLSGQISPAGAVSRKAVQKAKEQLEQTGTPFLGVVLNKFDVQLEKYGSYGNYGNYGNYGKKR